MDGLQTFAVNGAIALDLLFEHNICFDWGQGAMVESQPWGEFTYAPAAQRIVMKSGDPRLHLFETIVREQGIDLGDKQDVKVEGITVTNTLKIAN